MSAGPTAPDDSGTGNSRLAVYPGTFDPITNGHAYILKRSLKIFDRLVVALAVNVRKTPLFSVEERREMIMEAVDRDPRIEVDAFEGLLVDYMRRRAATTVIRGLRALADFEYEFQAAHMNRHLAPEIETIFLMTSEESFYVSSSLVKEVALMGGDVSRMVPPAVAASLARKFEVQVRSDQKLAETRALGRDLTETQNPQRDRRRRSP